MSSHFADIEVFVSNLDSADEADDVAALVEAALGRAGYQASVTVATSAYVGEEGGR